MTAYASWSQGYLPGGFNVFSASSKETSSYNPEYSTNYELGLKTHWLDGGLHASLAAFHADIHDKQVREEVPSAGVGSWKFTNSAKAHIPNGFHTEDFVFNNDSRKELRNQFNIGDSDFVVGHIGRFNPQKNHEFLLQIFENIVEIRPDTWLLLIGNGPDFEKINRIITQHRYKERIIVYGETKETAKMYSAMDVFAFPSKFEGLGIVALEAQINGLPVVASNCVPEEVNIGGRTQFLSLKEKPEKWAKEILNVSINLDRKSFYKQNMDTISMYEIENTVHELENYYKNIMEI